MVELKGLVRASSIAADTLTMVYSSPGQWLPAGSFQSTSESSA